MENQPQEPDKPNPDVEAPEYEILIEGYDRADSEQGIEPYYAKKWWPRDLTLKTYWSLVKRLVLGAVVLALVYLLLRLLQV